MNLIQIFIEKLLMKIVCSYPVNLLLSLLYF